MAAFERAAAASIPLQVVTSEGDLASAELKLPAEALTNLRKDLANGYVAIVPTELPPDEEMTGWWRVDRRTGETLGITGDGRGQALNIAALAEGVEYSMGMRLILGFTSAKMYGALCFGGALAAGMSYAGAGKVALGCAWEGFALAGEFHLMHGPGMILNFILHVTPH